MIVRNMRWGYDGGGVACGPVEGNTIVEICVTANDQKNYFVLATRMMEFIKLVLSPVPVFDILMEANHFDVDAEAEYRKFESNLIEEYDFEESEMDREFGNPEFEKAYRLVLLALQECYGSDEDELDDESAKEFIEPYVGENLDEIALPELEGIYNFIIPEEQEEVFKLRMALEAQSENPSIYMDMEDDLSDKIDKHLEMLEDACDDEDDYEAWREEYLETEYEKVKDVKFLACKYMFAGMGSYTAIIPETELDEFNAWIKGNGSAFSSEPREATEEEIKNYLAANAVSCP